MYKIIFIILFILSLISNVFSVDVKYDSINCSIDVGGYDTITEWEAATDNDLVSADSCYIGVIFDDDGDMTDSPTISGAITDATRYRMLTVVQSDRPSSLTDTGASLVMSGDLYISEDYFVLDGLNISSSADHGIQIKDCDSTTVKNCVIHNCARYGYFLDATSTTYTQHHWVYNCAFWLCSWAAVCGDAYNLHLYNCSIYDSGDSDSNTGSIYAYHGYIGAVNCISHNSEGNDFKDRTATDGKWLDETGWNISTDATAPGGFCRKSVTITDYYTNVSGGSENLALYQSCYAVDRGKFLTDYFTTDFDGNTRQSQSGLEEDALKWDIGADENTSLSAIDYNVVYVRPSGSSAWNAKNQDDVYCTIDSALDSAGTYGQVWVAEGRYQENIVIPSDRYVYGGFLGTETELGDRGVNWRYMTRSVIDGSGQDTCVVNMSNSTVIDGFKCVYGGGDQGAGIKAVGSQINYVMVRNCVIESCRVNGELGVSGAQGAAILFDSEDGSGVMTAKNCIARADTAFCGAIEVMTGSNAQANFINCISVNNHAFGIEISVDELENPPENLNHKIRNCVSTGNICPRSGGCSYNVNFWSWAKDSAYTRYCYSGDSEWSSALFWSNPDPTMIWMDEIGSTCWFDSTNGDYRLRGNSPLLNSGDSNFESYMGPIAPLVMRIINGN